MARIVRTFLRAPLSAQVGLVLIAFYLAVAILAPLIAPHGQSELIGAGFEPPTGASLLGTDHLGRDILSRMIFAARNTVWIALATTALSFTVGAIMGLAAASMQDWVDTALSRLVDILMAIPTKIFALLLLSIFGTSIFALILVIALLDSTRVFRLSRAVGKNIVAQDFISVARLRGEPLYWIIGRELLPNAIPPLVAEFGLRFCFVFLFISALSFLGIGIQPPTADWGSMVRESAPLMTFGSLIPLIPATAIAVLVVAVNLVVDWFLRTASGLDDGGPNV